MIRARLGRLALFIAWILFLVRVASAHRESRRGERASLSKGELILTTSSGERIRTGFRASEIVAHEVSEGETVVTIRDRAACVEEIRKVRFAKRALEAMSLHSRGLRALAKHDTRGAVRAFASAVEHDPRALAYRLDLARARLRAEGEASALDAIGPLDVPGLLSLALDDEVGRLTGSAVIAQSSMQTASPIALSADSLRGREVGVFFSSSRRLLAVMATQPRDDGLAPYAFLDVHDLEFAGRVARIPLSRSDGAALYTASRRPSSDPDAVRARRFGLALGRLGFVRLGETDLDYASQVADGADTAPSWTFARVPALVRAEAKQIVLAIDGATRVVAARDSAVDKVVEVVRIPRCGVAFVQLMTNQLEGCVQDSSEFAPTHVFRFVVGTEAREGNRFAPHEAK